MASARRAAALGYEGKWAIHPSPDARSRTRSSPPTQQLVEKTRRIIAAMNDAAADGKGAVSLDGRLIDAASIRMAENLLAKLEQIEERGATPQPSEPARKPAFAVSSATSKRRGPLPPPAERGSARQVGLAR